MRNRIKTQGPKSQIMWDAQAYMGDCPPDCTFDAQACGWVAHVDRVLLMTHVLLEAERKHIAREMHDELGQTLTALGLHLSLLRKRIDTQSPGIGNEVESLQVLIECAISRVRQVSNHLRPPALESGLMPAMECLCHEFTQLTQVTCQLHAPDDAVDLDKMRALVVYRIVQEALTNITRYANASQVDIRIGCSAHELSVEVHDNGCGFDPDEVKRQKQSFGLLGMRERAMVLGGRCDVISHPGRGTVVCLALPLGPAADIHLQ